MFYYDLFEIYSNPYFEFIYNYFDINRNGIIELKNILTILDKLVYNKDIDNLIHNNFLIILQKVKNLNLTLIKNLFQINYINILIDIKNSYFHLNNNYSNDINFDQIINDKQIINSIVNNINYISNYKYSLKIFAKDHMRLYKNFNLKSVEKSIYLYKKVEKSNINEEFTQYNKLEVFFENIFKFDRYLVSKDIIEEILNKINKLYYRNNLKEINLLESFIEEILIFFIEYPNKIDIIYNLLFLWEIKNISTKSNKRIFKKERLLSFLNKNFTYFYLVMQYNINLVKNNLIEEVMSIKDYQKIYNSNIFGKDLFGIFSISKNNYSKLNDLDILLNYYNII